MKHCKFCGKQISDYADICMHCGKYQHKREQNSNDGSSAGIAILGFLIPFIGFLMWLVWKPTLPLKARSAGKGALIGIVVEIIVFLLVCCGFLGVMFS